MGKQKEKGGTMDDFLKGFLGEGELELPTGGDFKPGFVGPIRAALLWKFWSSDKLDLAEWLEQKEGRKGFALRGRESSWFYFFEDRDEAKEAAVEAGAFAPYRAWQFEIPTSEVLNFGQGMIDPESVWGETIGRDCRIATYGSKYKHEFHMVSLPAAINALALRVGFIKESLFSLSELLDDGQHFSDEFQAQMIGGAGKPYQESKLWLQRAALWAALGEENAATYNPIGAGTSYDTTSDKLSQMLGIVTRPWVKPVWGRLVWVPDPRFDAVMGDGKRLSIPALTEIYESKEAAMEIVVAERGEDIVVAASPQKTTGLAVPADWAGFEAEWKDEIAGKKQALDGALPTGPKLAALAKELSASSDEVRTWWEVV